MYPQAMVGTAVSTANVLLQNTNAALVRAQRRDSLLACFARVPALWTSLAV